MKRMKYKQGQKVRIKKDLITHRLYTDEVVTLIQMTFYDKSRWKVEKRNGTNDFVFETDFEPLEKESSSFKNFLDQNIPYLYIIAIFVGIAIIFTVSSSREQHYKNGYNDAMKECYFLTKPTE
jgi:hypothetical protein